jgi:hypothetical protein
VTLQPPALIDASTLRSCIGFTDLIEPVASAFVGIGAQDLVAAETALAKLGLLGNQEAS